MLINDMDNDQCYTDAATTSFLQYRNANKPSANITSGALDNMQGQIPVLFQLDSDLSNHEDEGQFGQDYEVQFQLAQEVIHDNLDDDEQNRAFEESTALLLEAVCAPPDRSHQNLDGSDHWAQVTDLNLPIKDQEKKNDEEKAKSAAQTTTRDESNRPMQFSNIRSIPLSDSVGRATVIRRGRPDSSMSLPDPLPIRRQTWQNTVDQPQPLSKGGTIIGGFPKMGKRSLTVPTPAPAQRSTLHEHESTNTQPGDQQDDAMSYQPKPKRLAVDFSNLESEAHLRTRTHQEDLIQCFGIIKQQRRTVDDLQKRNVSLQNRRITEREARVHPQSFLDTPLHLNPGAMSILSGMINSVSSIFHIGMTESQRLNTITRQVACETGGTEMTMQQAIHEVIRRYIGSDHSELQKYFEAANTLFDVMGNFGIHRRRRKDGSLE